MSRVLSTLLGLSVLVAGFAGCNWDLDLDGIFAPPPGLELVPKRFALGAKVVTEIEAAGPDAAVWADNPDVIRVERVGSTLVELHAVGAGATVIRVEEDGRGEDYAVEVAPHERHEVLLVQRLWGLVPIVEIEQTILFAGSPQQILVALYDDDGLLFGAGLSDFVLPERSEACESDAGVSFDSRCLVVENGLHVMEVNVAGDHEVIVFGAVPEKDVVDILVVPSNDEENAEPDELIRVDLFGVTGRGRRVYGLPRESVRSDLGIAAPFAYQFEPSFPARVAVVEALGFEERITIRGPIRFPHALEHDCWSSVLFSGC